MDLKEALKGVTLDLVELKTRVPGQTEPAYFRPMTLADHDKVRRLMELEGGASEGLALAVHIIHKVVDKDGKKLFTMGDKTLLMQKVPNSILVAITNEISAEIDLDQAAKN